MSVTEIERWISNPYAIFARHILKLEPLPPLGASPDQSLRGGLVHEVLSQFAIALPDRSAGRPARRTREDRERGARKLYRPSARRRLLAAAPGALPEWFADGEAERRGGVRAVFAETTGSLVLASGALPFTLTARADRIDDKGAASSSPTTRPAWCRTTQPLQRGRSPQLPLEAAIALGDSGFPNLSGRSVEGLRYIRASGGEPPGEERIVRADDIAELADRTRRGLERLIAEFDDPTRPTARCGGRVSATTTTTTRTWRASRNGRRMSMTRRRHEPRKSRNEKAVRRRSPASTPIGRKAKPPIPTSRPGSAPTPAPARRTC